MAVNALQPTIRDDLDAGGGTNRLGPALSDIKFGTLLAALVQAMSPTENDATVTSDSITLANRPSVVLDVVAVTATVTGRKKLLIGDENVVPATGECVWDGASTIRFAAADAVTVADLKYLVEGASAPTISVLMRNLDARGT